MITKLPDDYPVHRNWNGRDDNGQNFFGKIPPHENEVTIKLTWKKDRESSPYTVGSYKLDMNQLCQDGYVRLKDDGGYILRFQRTGRNIQIAINRGSQAVLLDQLPSSY